MLLVFYGVVRILCCDVFLDKLTGRISRKMGNAKVTSVVYSMHIKIRGKVEILSDPYDAEGVWRDAP